MKTIKPLARTFVLLSLLATGGGCQQLVEWTDRDVAVAIRQRQRELLHGSTPVRLDERREPSSEPDATSYAYVPPAVPPGVPAGFEVQAGPITQPQTSQPASGPASAPTAGSQPALAPSATSRPATQPHRSRPLTLTDALAYADRHRRALQTAREDLYLAALALTLERHLWTPQFAAELRTVYGNFGEIRDFDQAMRFVADLNVSQRLPYGGQFTARAIATLIRDVKRSITASETGQIVVSVDVPLLRGAGHVAREDLIQLNRELGYAVRTFERFRRQQLVDVARAYFDLLRSKQDVIDALNSVTRAEHDYERAQAVEEAAPAGDVGSPLDTRRALQRLLNERSRAAQLRESFRFAADRFKLLIGMPVDEPLGLEDLESIDQIEQKVVEGIYPLLRRPPAADDELRSLDVAIQYRLDLLNARDRIDDAKRGVAIAANALLPELNLTSSVTFDTDPAHFRVTRFETERATWRSELILSMNDRFAEKNAYRRSLIDVRRARRSYVDLLEQVRVDVRRAINQLRLQEKVLELQRQNVEVAGLRAEFARLQFEEGDLGNRDVVEAEDELIGALNQLNLAKTARWSALLEYRLATGTLRVDEFGRQLPTPALDGPASPPNGEPHAAVGPH